MAKAKTRRASIVVTLMVLAFLGSLFHYLLNYDYKVEQIGEDAAYQLGALEPELKVEEDSQRNIVLRFSLRNSTQTRMKLADSILLTPLYEVTMRAKDEDGKFEVCPPSPKSMAMKRKESTDRSSITRDSLAMVELFPASSYTRTINLSDLFDFQRKGTFNVSINYRPDELARASEEIASLHFYKQHMKLNTSFELPLKKPETDTPPPKAEPKAAPVSKIIDPNPLIDIKPRVEPPVKTPAAPAPPSNPPVAEPTGAPKE